jgi:hypothetical protein
LRAFARPSASGSPRRGSSSTEALAEHATPHATVTRVERFAPLPASFVADSFSWGSTGGAIEGPAGIPGPYGPAP